MRYLKTFSTCLIALALHSTAWAQIYETTDAEGNPDFTDSPAAADAEVVNLPETNLIGAPQPEQQGQSQSNTETVEQAPVQENNTTVNVNGGSNNDDYGDGAYDDDLARQRAVERGALAAPGEVGDPAYEMPREVGDSESQMPREVGDSESQMPREVGDSESQMPREVGDSESQMPREVGDSESQMPHEVGDFPAGTGTHRR